MAVAIIVIPDTLKSTADAAIGQVYPCNSGPLFSRKLSADGSEPHSHWCTNPIVSDEVMERIHSLAASEPFASLAHLRVCEPFEVVAKRAELLVELDLNRIEVEE